MLKRNIDFDKEKEITNLLNTIDLLDKMNKKNAVNKRNSRLFTQIRCAILNSYQHEQAIDECIALIKKINEEIKRGNKYMEKAFCNALQEKSCTSKFTLLHYIFFGGLDSPLYIETRRQVLKTLLQVVYESYKIDDKNLDYDIINKKQNLILATAKDGCNYLHIAALTKDGEIFKAAYDFLTYKKIFTYPSATFDNYRKLLGQKTSKGDTVFSLLFKAGNGYACSFVGDLEHILYASYHCKESKKNSPSQLKYLSYLAEILGKKTKDNLYFLHSAVLSNNLSIMLKADLFWNKVFVESKRYVDLDNYKTYKNIIKVYKKMLSTTVTNNKLTLLQLAFDSKCKNAIKLALDAYLLVVPRKELLTSTILFSIFFRTRVKVLLEYNGEGKIYLFRNAPIIGYMGSSFIYKNLSALNKQGENLITQALKLNHEKIVLKTSLLMIIYLNVSLLKIDHDIITTKKVNKIKDKLKNIMLPNLRCLQNTRTPLIKEWVRYLLSVKYKYLLFEDTIYKLGYGLYGNKMESLLQGHIFADKEEINNLSAFLQETPDEKKNKKINENGQGHSHFLQLQYLSIERIIARPKTTELTEYMNKNYPEKTLCCCQPNNHQNI